ncbi:zinc-dependent alcohol dehydrogenase family protein [Lutimaribacter saemankumensis]|uniref:Alcohol dehydrogenase n=1 Tax=Lutimaribacter saemankumensis TaxID=490829 RepID=A0A1G8Q6N9_9RHOB|nr:zinc-dependent alcohol dehydrogenase family protein [Lutimaribacter saemankumensis]SDJ00452.1 alcohol dehydrogenase [Lutimaribacter saemankumensis]
MKALVMDRYDSALSLESVDDPTCPPDGVVVQVMACGVCRSDHHAWKGADPDVVLPHVMGHEFAGTVAEVGRDVRGFRVGDRVTAPFILACGHCPDCRTGDPTTCNHQEVIGFTGWGAFAERLAVPRADFNLVHLPDSLGYDEAAGMGCRVTTAFRAVVDRGDLRPGEWLVVHGCGGVGLSAVMVGAALGARVLAVDVKDDALTMARDLGATAVLNVTGIDDVGAAVRDMTDGGAHVSVEALGVTATFENSVRSLRKLGRHVQIGMPLGRHETVSLPLLELVYSRQISIAGSRGMAARRFDALFGMIAGGRLDISRLVTGRIALGQAEAALRAMDDFQGAGVTVITDFTR